MIDHSIDRYARARSAREEVVREIYRRKARRYIERTQPPGPRTDLVLEALGLTGVEPAASRVCPHCGQPFNVSRPRCQRVACARAGLEVRRRLEVKILEAGRAGTDDAG